MMSLHRHLVEDERGFSLSELLVVLGLMGAVLAVAWAGLFGIRQSDRIASSQGDAATAFGDPMEEMSKILMQNTSVRTTSSNRIEVWTDRDLNGMPELNAFYPTSDGTLVWEWWQYNTARTAFTAHRTWVMSEVNANLAQGVPLFTYYVKNGSALSGADIASKGPSDTVYVKVRLTIDLDGRTETDVREVSFRTRS